MKGKATRSETSLIHCTHAPITRLTAALSHSHQTRSRGGFHAAEKVTVLEILPCQQETLTLEFVPSQCTVSKGRAMGN